MLLATEGLMRQQRSRGKLKRTSHYICLLTLNPASSLDPFLPCHAPFSILLPLFLYILSLRCTCCAAHRMCPLNTHDCAASTAAVAR